MCPKITWVSKTEHTIIRTNGVTIKICKKLFNEESLNLLQYHAFIPSFS